MLLILLTLAASARDAYDFTASVLRDCLLISHFYALLAIRFHMPARRAAFWYFIPVRICQFMALLRLSIC